MQDKNVDFCGILNLLSALKKAGFPKAELEQVAVRIAMQTPNRKVPSDTRSSKSSRGRLSRHDIICL